MTGHAPASPMLRFVRGGLAVSGLVLRLVIIVFMFAPVATVAVLSFANENVLVFPPRSWGLDLYRTFFSSPSWIGAVGTSFEIGLPAALLALAIGVPAAYAITRTRLPFRGALQLAGLTPIILPAVAYAVALYIYYIQLHLLDTTAGVILAHATLGVPFVLLIVGAALTRISPELELVAMTLGANRRRAITGVTLRLVMPAIAAAYIFAFLASFDEATLVQFIAGPSQTTLPKAVFDSLRTGIQPLILAIATLMMAGIAVILLVGLYWRDARARD